LSGPAGEHHERESGGQGAGEGARGEEHWPTEITSLPQGAAAPRDLRQTFRKPPQGKLRKASLLVLLRSDLQSMYGPEGAVGGPIGAPLLVALGVGARH